MKDFLGRHQAVFGHGAERLDRCALLRHDSGSPSGLSVVVWQQQLEGIPVEGALLTAGVSRTGDLLSVQDRTSRNDLPQGLSIVPTLNAQDALVSAIAQVGGTAAQVRILQTVRNGDLTRLQHLGAQGVKGPAYARLRWLLHQQQPVLCWQIIATSAADGLMRSTLVDATSGVCLKTQILTVQDTWTGKADPNPDQVLPASKAHKHPGMVHGPAAVPVGATEIRLRCYPWPYESPRPRLPGSTTPNPPQPATVSSVLIDPSDLMIPGSPQGWVDTDETRGNNVYTYIDANDDDEPDAIAITGTSTGGALHFDFVQSLAAEPDVNNDARRASAVNLFYWNNFMHDMLYRYGFTESAGNFQARNFSQGGLQDDPVEAQAQDGSIPHIHPGEVTPDTDLNNANMSTPPDGFSPRMQMYLWDTSTPKRDGSHDATVIIHEYTHGLSWRICGGGDPGLDTFQSAGLGEGWSDFYPCALLAEDGEALDGNYIVGAYATRNYNKGIRTYPYTTDLVRNPWTLARTNEAQSFYIIGELWCTSLWEIRCALVQRYGLVSAIPEPYRSSPMP